MPCPGKGRGRAAFAAIAELAGVASLPFAIGLYLPITTTASLIFGGLIAEWRPRPSKWALDAMRPCAAG